MVKKIYKDREENEIGTIDYLNGSYIDLMLNIGLGIKDFNDNKPFDIKIIHDRINIYLAVRYCYNGDTSSADACINGMLKQVPNFAEHIGYKPII